MEAPPPDSALNTNLSPVHLPRITIQFCTQCKWMLRATYFAQELLSTFSTSLGEVSLLPSTGGVFTVDLTHELIPALENREEASNGGEKWWNTQTTRIWDRKAEGGFPETKTLKRLVRNIIDPSRDLGHVDRQKNSPPPSLNPAVTGEPSGSGAVLVQDQKSTQVTTTTPAVIIQVARQEDNNNNINDNEGIKSWGSEENEQEGLLPTETTVADGVLVPFLEKQQQQEREQDQKNENNRVFCQDCT